MHERRWNLSFDWPTITQGLLLMAASLILPFFVTAGSLGIYSELSAAVTNRDFSHIMVAVIKVLALNCLRTSPSYLSAFVICEGIHIRFGKREYVGFKGLFSLVILLFLYKFIALTSGVVYHFGGPAIMVALFITLLINWNLFPVSLFSKMMLVAIVVVTAQSLTIHPALSRFGFGYGEVAHDIKTLSTLMGYGHALSFFSLALFLAFLMISLIVIKLLKDEYRIQINYQERTAILQQLSESRIKSLELRTYGELQNIVHDLKTPLSTIQGLSSLSEMLVTDDRIREYQSRISQAADVMSSMISELLYEDQRTVFTTQELLRLTASYLSADAALSQMITYHNNYPQGCIRANRVRIIRAIINLLENAYAACRRSGKEDSHIDLTVDHCEGRIRFCVFDNGDGISMEQMENIWNPGFSGHNSSGLGLSFVKNVINAHGGTIEIDSAKGAYTSVTILLDEVKEDED